MRFLAGNIASSLTGLTRLAPHPRSETADSAVHAGAYCPELTREGQLQLSSTSQAQRLLTIELFLPFFDSILGLSLYFDDLTERCGDFVFFVHTLSRMASSSDNA